jgi:P-type Ca2+ transporter type 2C
MTRRLLPVARLGDLLTSDRGLTAAEVGKRRARYGLNDILETPPSRWRDLARDTVKDPMIWFLAGVSGLYAGVGELKEAVILLVAIVPLVGMDAFLHWRTQASTEGLKSRLAERANVVRDSVPAQIPARELVPGDLALVAPAEAFPADGIIVGGADLQVDESSLTGEAYPVAKRPPPGSFGRGEEPLVDVQHWGFAGTRLLTGRAAFRVIFTGAETLYGEIVHSAVHGTHDRTPLQAAIQNLVTVLLGAASVICVILAVVRIFQGHGWLDALLSAVTLAAAAIPEEFPVVFTFFLGVGVYRLARRQALVRRAVAVENIGRITAICSDKTGTITEGRLRLTHLVPAEGIGEQELLYLGALASRSDSGDPIDEAIARRAAAAALEVGGETLARFPFTEGRRRETAIVRLSNGVTVAVTKGAAETILTMSVLTSGDRETWEKRIVRLAEDGHKVIASASQSVDAVTATGEEPEHGYRIVGLLAFEDPVRDGVAQAIDFCRDAGIHPIMVTGDHPGTARAVAREIGLGGTEPRVLTGDAMEALVARGEGRTLREVDVIARATPPQKLTLVRALRETGDIVAVTGDGVNDVPALQAADIGIAMGERGTRSAREIAAIVLLDDNFRTIVGAIAEGRQLFRNLQLSFAYLLIFHIPFVVSALAVPLLGYPLLYLPVHIVWVELILHPTALLVFQELPVGGLAPARRDGVTAFFSRGEWALIIVVGSLITCVVIGGYVWNVEARGSAEHGRAMAIATLALASAALAATFSRLRTRMARLITTLTLASSVLIIQTPVLAVALHLEPLHVEDWGIALVGSVVAACLPLMLGRRDLAGEGGFRPAGLW